MIETKPRQPCTALTRAGAPCRAWAVPGSDPPRCATHGSAPQTDRSAPTHGDYAQVSLDDLIADLDGRIRELSGYIDRLDLAAEPGLYARLVGLHGQLCSRLGRLLRDRQALGGEADGLQAAIDEALDLVAQTLQVDV